MSDKEKVAEIERQWIGKTVIMVGDHPHAHCVGIVEKREGSAFLVKATNCSHMTDGWYVFNGKHWRVVE